MKQKVKDLLYILFIYLIAFFAAMLTLKFAPIPDILWKTAAADVVATIVIFIFSMIKNNSSVYDPYWSTAPAVIVLYWLFDSPQTDFVFKIIWVLVVIWGARLTWNWILRWDGFGDEDWRYINFRKKTGKFYWLVSFLAIHLLPTIFLKSGQVISLIIFADLNFFGSLVYTYLILERLITVLAFSLSAKMVET